MPRSHVSVARFYDWSEDLGECFSVSQFYRDLAAYNKLQNGKAKEKSRGVNPGRMFLRDKAGLTKGEREIIEGIYRNRCNIGKDDFINESREDLNQIRSHRDAWLIGKHLHKNSNRSDSDGKSDLASSPTDSGNNSKGDEHNEGALAPPTTPDPEDYEDNAQHLWKRKPAHKNIHGHPLDISNSNCRQTARKDAQGRKKLYVNVFLPSISGELQPPQDSLNSSLNLPPAEGPRHPLYSEHARNIFREKQEKARFSRMNSSSIVKSSTVQISENE